MIGEATYTIAQSVAADEEVIAIGDIHGGADLLAGLLDHAAGLPRRGRRTLVLTGDLVDRGPATLATLDLAMDAARLARADAQVGLMGNHEQMLLSGLSGDSWLNAQAYHLWIANGGDAVLRELFGARWELEHSPALVREALGPRLGFLRGLRSHWHSGDVLFVHAGLSPRKPSEAFLATPWLQDFDAMREDEHWAWIRGPFLRAERHHGLFVCHGHTPGDGLTRRGAATVAQDRLNLDLGSTRTGMARMARFVGREVTVYDLVGGPNA